MDNTQNSLGLATKIKTSRSAEAGLKGVDLNRNVEALIENPLASHTPESLLRDVTEFARDKNLTEHLPLLKKGAQIAKDPRFFETVRGITDYEKQALRDEDNHRFRQPLPLYLTIITCCVGAAVQGWDQTGSNGANLNWPQDFHLDPDNRTNDFWIFGLVNAAPYISSALMGFSANLAMYQIGAIAWRLQLGSAFIPAVPLLIGIYFCPESPRWYIKKHKYLDAFNSLRRLRNTELQAARDLYYIHAQVRLEELMLGDGDFVVSGEKENWTKSGRYWARFKQLFLIARVRRATLAAFVVMIAQQMCGINIMAFYSSTLFIDANADEKTALLVSWGFGLINFV
ncbi:MAG: hypothetical protein Q9214_000729 [Letrouitia sp. 1 TL-2023]